MKHWSCFFVVACVVSSTGCAGTISDTGDTRAGEDKVGTLQLALTGTDSKNQQYRLRQATFPISGNRYDTYESIYTSVSSEDDPDSPTLRARLFYGYYYVSPPSEGWYLERITENGSERVEHAVVLTTGSQYVVVNQGATTQVAFQFGVDGELIDFIGGNLEIDIGIQNAPDAGAAN